MGHHYKIINKQGDIHSTSENIMVPDGFGKDDNFRGYDSVMIADFWGRDRMTLYSLSKSEWEVETYHKYYSKKSSTSEKELIQNSKDWEKSQNNSK